jgi:diacylglycerol kinase (ATP)
MRIDNLLFTFAIMLPPSQSSFPISSLRPHASVPSPLASSRKIFSKFRKSLTRNSNPLLIFVNKDSGGRQGLSILKSIESACSKEKICDLSQQIPSEFLAPFRNSSTKLRILCCGGDGTVNWILKELEKFNMSRVPIAVIPMGTGNDLVRTLESSHFPNRVNSVTPVDLCQDPKSALKRFSKPKTCQIDMWNADIFPITSGLSHFTTSSHLAITPSLEPKSQWKDEHPSLSKIMVNYCSIGLDGAVSLAFDKLRKTQPRYFFSSLINKAWYGVLGTRIFLTEKLQDLSKSRLTIKCDGEVVTLPPSTEGLIILSVSSYMGGTKIWPSLTAGRSGLRSLWKGKEEKKWTTPSASDGILEVTSPQSPLP